MGNNMCGQCGCNDKNEINTQQEINTGKESGGQGVSRGAASSKDFQKGYGNNIERQANQSTYQ